MRKTGFLLLTLFITAIILELGLGLYFNLSGESRTANNIKKKYTVKESFRYKNHPFFGLVYTDKINEINNGQSVYVNNFGFLAQDDYPYGKKEDELRIGIFGGSVALSLSLYLFKNPQVVKSLEEKIGKKIKILNFALGMGRQPQQLNIAAYFADSFDISINLDGFNEFVVIDYPNNPIDFPFVDYFKLLRNSNVFEKYVTYKRNKDFLRESFQSRFLSKISLFYLYQKYLIKKTEELERSIDFELRKKYFFKNKNEYSLETYQLAIDKWLEHGKKQNLLLKSLGKKSYFFLQPNLFVKDSKPFTSSEIENQNDPFYATSDGMNDIYSMAITSIQSSSTLKYIDATNVFKTTHEAVYIDRCCHLNNIGLKHLTDFIFSHI